FESGNRGPHRSSHRGYAAPNYTSCCIGMPCALCIKSSRGVVRCQPPSAVILVAFESSLATLALLSPK
ncbi:hypothetical protein HAX54_002899, partial [Datura stramonium]|nr:hypothetical protein [Datura stramonium]